MMTAKRALVCLGLTLLVGACDDDEEPTDRVDDASAPDSGSPDGGAADAASDAAGDATLDGKVDASSEGDYPDAAGFDDPRFPDAGAFYEQYQIMLTTAAESPVCAMAGPAAVGTATLTISGLHGFDVMSLTWQNLSSAVVSAHVHYGSAGMSGPIVVPLTTSPGSSSNGVGSAQTYQAKPGAPPTFAEFMTELRAGKAYLNVHTESCPGGEIRGQIVTQ